MGKNLNGKGWIATVIIALIVVVGGSLLWKLPLKHEREIGEIKTEQTNAKEERTEIKTEIREQREIVQDIRLGQELILEKFKLRDEYRKRRKENNTE